MTAVGIAASLFRHGVLPLRVGVVCYLTTAWWCPLAHGACSPLGRGEGASLGALL
jgi:hypothetical protein